MSHPIKIILKQAAICAVCLVSFLFVWILAIPLVRNFYLSTSRWLRFPLILTLSVAMLFLGQPLSLCVLLIPVFILESKQGIGFLWLKKSSLANKTKRTVFFLLVVALHLGISYLLKNLFSQGWQSELDVWTSKVLEYLESSQQSEKLLAGWENFYKYFPSVYLGTFFTAYFLSYWNTWYLNKIEIPALFFWSILTSFCLAFLDFEFIGGQLPEVLQVVAKNVFFVLCAMYFFQGVAVLNSFFERVKIARFWRNMWYILIILYLPVGLVFMGVAEFLFDYRENYKSKRKDI